MATIEENLAKILSSRYGEDVRQSIHDSIEQCYEDASGDRMYRNMGGWDNSKPISNMGPNTIYFVSSSDTYGWPVDEPIDIYGNEVGPGFVRTTAVGTGEGSSIRTQEFIAYNTFLQRYAAMYVRSTSLDGGYDTPWANIGEKYEEEPKDYTIRSWIVQNYKTDEENGYYNKGVWVENEGWKAAKIPCHLRNKFIISKVNNFIDLYKGDTFVKTLTWEEFQYEVIPGSTETFYRYFVPTNIDFDYIYFPYINDYYTLYSTPFDHPTIFFDAERTEDDEIVVSGGRIVNKEEADHLEADDVFNGVMTFNGVHVVSSPYVTTKLMLFKKGTIIDTKNTGLRFDIRGSSKGSSFLYVTKNEANQHYEFQEDAYASINAEYSGVKWPDDDPDIDILDRRYFIRILRAEDRNRNPWKGKVWWAYGTSITDIGPDDTVGNNGHSGKYPLSLEAYSELQRNNGAIGSGGILDDKADNRNYRLNILETPYDTDLVTIETLPNDNYTTKLGEIGDTEPSTICGALTQCFEYLTNSTRARIVLLIVTGSIHEMNSETPTVNYKPYESSRTNWKRAVDKITELANLYGVKVINADENAIDWGRRKTGLTYRDHIHLNYLGGEIYGKYIWEQLKNVAPYPSGF